MRTKSLLAGTAAGVMLGLGAVVAADVATESADAQGGFQVTAGQLKINQNISSAAVRRSNRGLNYLAPIRTQATDNADDGTNGVTPLAQVPGSGDGWTNSQIANEAINSEKIAPGGVTSGDLADNSVTNSKLDADSVGTDKIQDGAVTSSKIDPGVEAGIAYFAYVNNAGNLQGSRGFSAASRPATGVYQLTTTFNLVQSQCPVNATVQDPGGGVYLAKYTVINANTLEVRTFFQNASDNFVANNEPFGVSLHCTN